MLRLMFDQASDDSSSFSLLRSFRVAFGWALIFGALGYAGWAIYELASFGTCSSGGPYVTVRECADGTGTKIFGIMGSVFVVLVGVALAASWRAAAAAWGLTFTGGGIMFFAGAFGPDSDVLLVPFTVCGVIFVAMGLPGLWEAVRPKTRVERRQRKVRGPYGVELTVDAPEDGGPAPVVMAKPAVGQPAGFPWNQPPR